MSLSLRNIYIVYNHRINCIITKISDIKYIYTIIAILVYPNIFNPLTPISLEK